MNKIKVTFVVHNKYSLFYVKIWSFFSTHSTAITNAIITLIKTTAIIQLAFELGVLTTKKKNIFFIENV